MNYRERMKEYLKEPDEYSSQYGKWGILNREQRDLIRRLLREMDSADEVIKQQYEEIERLNNIINELEKWLEEKSDVDYRCSDRIVHEQLALSVALRKLRYLKDSDKE